eukprot:5492440-Pleurochrysis_carterae.AAC.1
MPSGLATQSPPGCAMSLRQGPNTRNPLHPEARSLPHNDHPPPPTKPLRKDPPGRPRPYKPRRPPVALRHLPQHRLTQVVRLC